MKLFSNSIETDFVKGVTIIKLLSETFAVRGSGLWDVALFGIKPVVESYDVVLLNVDSDDVEEDVVVSNKIVVLLVEVVSVDEPGVVFSVSYVTIYNLLKLNNELYLKDLEKN